MAGDWVEAAVVNREIIENSPIDQDAYNRLGKALLEIGDTQAARSTFEYCLLLNPSNTIAQKNIERLSSGATSGGGSFLSHKIFINETGKSTKVALLGCATDSSRPNLAPGSPIDLRVHKGNMVVYSEQGQYVGIVPPRVGQRLVAPIEGGNRYGGGVLNSSADTIRVVLHESYQHPSQQSTRSFPAMASALHAPMLAVPEIEPLEEFERIDVDRRAEAAVEELRELDSVDPDKDSLLGSEGEAVDASSLLDREYSVEEELEEAI